MWPAIPTADGAAVLGLLFQLEGSQWLAPERLRELQLRQLEPLLRHAYATVPWYREHWSGIYDPALPLTPEQFAALPLLSRRDLQTDFQNLRSRSVPQAHGAVGETSTSGSTGTPVRVLKSELTQLFWRAFTLRDHLWHKRDLSLKLAAIRHPAVEGKSENWGQATAGLVATGAVATLGVAIDIEKQLDWLESHNPSYFLAYPSVVSELARASIARSTRLPALREVRTLGETLAPETRELCREAWDVPVTDIYSADEVGYIALQCPDDTHYHIQSENVLLEVLDDRGEQCGPGKTGRVVVTALHNFAMPLIRYEIGDYAEPGAACLCGRGLPVLRRVMGRVRNTLVTRNGERFWPTFNMRELSEVAPVVQHQFVQKSYDLLEARLVLAAPATSEQEAQMCERILARLPKGFRVTFSYCDTIPRSPGEKFDDFISEVAATADSR